MAWLEEFHAWKLLGGESYGSMPARTVDAFAVLENELRTERNSGEH